MEESVNVRVGEYVWAKVKGFPFWPGVIIDDKIVEDKKIGAAKKKGHHCVKFFGEGNWAWVTPENIKDYVQNREQNLKNSKKASFLKSVRECDSSVAKATGLQLEPPVFASSGRASTKSASNVSLSTTPEPPKTETPKTDVFKKKITIPQSAPIQKDYSRTPFKKEKRNFESAFDAIINEPLPAKKLYSKETPTGGGDKARRSAVKSASSTTATTAPSTPVTTGRRSSIVAAAAQSASKPNSNEFDVSSSDLSKMEKISISFKGSGLRSYTRYGFIGLDKMGSNLLNLMGDLNPKNITIWNADLDKCREFEAKGFVSAMTPADLVRNSDIIFSCLADAETASNIFFGNCGVRGEINASKGYVELTPLDATTSIQINKAVQACSGRYLEAPIVNYTLQDLESGSLTALMAGNRSLFDDCGSFFHTICSQVFFLSESAGVASKMNIAIGLVNGVQMGALSEALTFIDRLGLIRKDFAEILRSSAFCSPLLIDRAEAMVCSTFTREMPIDDLRRDLGYALDLSNQINNSIPITAVTNEILKQKKHSYF